MPEIGLTQEPKTGTVSKIHAKPDPKPQSRLSQF